jgi:hypothetical protein
VRDLFTEAGFTDLSIEPFEAPVLIGGRGTLDNAVEFLRHTRLAQAMLSEAPDDAAARAVAAIREALSGYLTDDGVRLGGGAWIVTAS